MYSESAALYDLIYAPIKDYPAEAGQVAGLLRRARPRCRTLLDVACGTAEHARLLGEVHGFEVDGVDLEPKMVAIARAKCPRGRFDVADMTNFHVGRRYDGVICLFGSIGHVVTLPRVHEALDCMRDHLAPGGVVVVQPCLTPDTFEIGTDEYTVVSGDLRVTETRRSERDGRHGRLHLRYTIEGPDGTQHVTEIQELGLFTVDEMQAAFSAVGLTVVRDPHGPGRGVYVASMPA